MDSSEEIGRSWARKQGHRAIFDLFIVCEMYRPRPNVVKKEKTSF